MKLTDMDESAKETVIIVHGTWAEPNSGKSQWYQQPPDNASAPEGFVRKLDAALQERSSRARCWAHCNEGDAIFQWSGENSWIERTRAAATLAVYVRRLRNEGWRCHIVAHSHGGNVAVEALLQIIAAPSADEPPLGTIVTLGSPFMDTMSPVVKRTRRATKIVNFVSWFGFAIFAMALATLASIAHPVIGVITLITLSVGVWLVRSHRIRPSTAYGNAQGQPPPLFAMGSPMDEAWQILHHMRTMPNPLAVTINPLSYLLFFIRSNISRSNEVARILGAKSYGDLGIVAKFLMAIMHGATVLAALFSIIVVVIVAARLENEPHPFVVVLFFVIGFTVVIFTFVLFVTKFLGGAFYSAYLSPFRWCSRRLVSLGGIFSGMATYVVRYRGWSVLQALAMGLEGYRFTLPLVEQFPRNLSEKFVKYENMPSAAEQRALERRSAWIARHLGDVSQTFSELAVTTADITSLLRTIEEDQTLVHAAYYTDEECIARIAEWITDKG